MDRTPIFTALQRHANKNTVQFHIPGHNKGTGMDAEFREFIGSNALSIDLITIAPLDDPHRPRGVIKEAQELAAKAYGADQTFFCVEGTSSAIRVMIASVCAPGDQILVPRNVHKSVMSGIILSGASPIFLTPDYDEEFDIAHGISLETIKEALETNPRVKALLVINPTYYGVCADLRSVVELAHSYGVPVLVDEAHGAHLKFHNRLPLSAMQANADISATSLHKLGGSLTQTSLLNVRRGLVSVERVFSLLSMITTTSPSYILMASIDCARRNLAINGERIISEALSRADRFRSAINDIPGVKCFGNDMVGVSSSRFAYDPLKLCINVKGLGLTGIAVEGILRDEWNIEVEMSNLYNILCIVTLGTVDDDLSKLVRALRDLSARLYDASRQYPTVETIPTPKRSPTVAFSPREAFFAETEDISLDECAGRAVADTISVYPPGIPILVPGEVITSDIVEYLRICDHAGLSVQGLQDGLSFIRVVLDR